MSSVCFSVGILFYMLTISSAASVSSRPPKSPCPGIFTYQRTRPAGDVYFVGRDNPYWMAVVMVPTNILIPREDLHLTLKMTIPGALQSEYVGRIEFQGDKQLLASGKMETAKFDFHFPSNVAIPTLLRITVNDRVLCKGNKVQAPMVTTLIIQHSLFLSRINLNNNMNMMPSVSDVPGFRSSARSQNPVCGTFADGNPLVVKGEATLKTDWPWLVPIYSAISDIQGVKFVCAGTLVSAVHVISAAHCFKNIKNPKDLVLYVGRRKISNWADKDSQPRGVKRLTRHPDFDPQSLYSDIAVLELKEPVQWTPTVSPACLWKSNDNVDHVVGKIGTVVGWGTQSVEKMIVSAEPKSAELPIVSPEVCLRSSLEFYAYTSNRTLCAGSKDGKGPCNGDSGGGLYLPLRTSGRGVQWFLRGIVSLSLKGRDTDLCDLSQYIVFTDVAKFSQWLSSIMASSG